MSPPAPAYRVPPENVYFLAAGRHVPSLSVSSLLPFPELAVQFSFQAFRQRNFKSRHRSSSSAPAPSGGACAPTRFLADPAIPSQPQGKAIPAPFADRGPCLFPAQATQEVAQVTTAGPLPHTILRGSPLWPESLCVLPEQSPHMRLAPKQPHALKPEALLLSPVHFCKRLDGSSVISNL